MLGFGKGRARIEAIEDANAATAAQLLALSKQFRDQVSALEEKVAGLEARIVEQDVALDALRSRDAASQVVIDAQRDAITQLQADLFRIERHAEADFKEVRQTSQVLAETLLLERKRTGAA